jgi:GNAT superfamily N-acetyltransferase
MGANRVFDTAAGDWKIRRGTVADYEGTRRLWETVYGVPRSIESLRWLYEANPAGPCQLWVAEELGTGQIIAARPVFPWRVRAGHRELVVGQAGDAMTHPRFRRRGVFTSLVEVVWSELRDQGIPFSFSFSNACALAVYRKTVIGHGPRAGTHEVLGFRRMMYPLSWPLILGRAPVIGGLVAGLDLPHRLVQHWRLTLSKHLSVFRVHRFDREFDDLWMRTAAQHGVLTVRDSRYLNWRFIDPPTGAFQVLGLRSHGELVGYIAFEVDAEGNGWIADLFGRPNPETVAALLKAGLAAMLERRCAKASILVATENPLFWVLRSVGFLERAERFPMAVHVHRDGAEAEVALDARRWWAWYGDRDVERLIKQPSPQTEEA